MQNLVRRVADRCLKTGIVEVDDIEWFIYALEKRISTAVSSVFFLLIAVIVSDPLTAVSYLGSFYFLRIRTNGYHAKTFIGCLSFSLFLELAFILFILPRLTIRLTCILNAISFILIFFFAPFNHPNMHLNAQELIACRTSSRRRILILIALEIFLYALCVEKAVYGITLGNTMTAFLLVIAIINKGDNTNEKRKRKSQKAA